MSRNSCSICRGSGRTLPVRDRKSTRLNSSHLVISYAVFCLKKKKKIEPPWCCKWSEHTSYRQPPSKSECPLMLTSTTATDHVRQTQLLGPGTWPGHEYD